MQKHSQRTLTHSFTLSLTHPLTHSLIHLLTHSLIHSLIHSLNHLSTHSITSPLTHPLTRLLTHLSTHSCPGLLINLLFTCDPLTVTDAVVYGVGTLKLLASNPQLRVELETSGIANLAQHYLEQCSSVVSTTASWQ